MACGAAHMHLGIRQRGSAAGLTGLGPGLGLQLTQNGFDFGRSAGGDDGCTGVVVVAG